MPLGRDHTARLVFAGRELNSEVFGTLPVGGRSISFAPPRAGWPIKRWRRGPRGCKPLPIAPGAPSVLPKAITPQPK